MAKVKYTGITIKLGAAHDSVTVDSGQGNPITFDRAEMRKQGAHSTQGVLRRSVVEAWEKERGHKDAHKARSKRIKSARRAKRTARLEHAEG